jgi:hypothetical protein
MKIMFLVEYFYRPAAPESERFKADVIAYLPKEPGEEHIAWCYLGKIGDYEVQPNSGITEKNFRMIMADFCADSVEKLDQMIENAIEDYRRQVVKNIEIIQNPPISREIIKDFPDLIKDDGAIIGIYSRCDDPDC